MFKMFAIRQKSSNHVLKWAVILLSLAMAVWNFYNLKFYSLFETEYVYLWEDTSFAKKTCVFVHCKEFDFKSSALQCCCRLYQYKGRSIPEVGDHIITNCFENPTPQLHSKLDFHSPEKIDNFCRFWNWRNWNRIQYLKWSEMRYLFQIGAHPVKYMWREIRSAAK